MVGIHQPHKEREKKRKKKKKNKKEEEEDKKHKKEKDTKKHKKEKSRTKERGEGEADEVFDRTLWQQHHNGILSPGDTDEQGKGDIYFFGIIDYLCTYNGKKKFARIWKHNVLLADEVMHILH